MTTMQKQHISVLFNEVIDGLDIKPNGIYVDGTFGRGGHSTEILNRLNEEGRLFVFDKDDEAIKTAKHLMGNDSRVTIVHADFSTMKNALDGYGLLNKVDAVFLDLGVSSPQLDQAERGFSFMNDGPLDMRMDRSNPLSAEVWINKADEKEIANVLWQLGEEKFSRRIAKVIVERREESPLKTTLQLAALIKECVPNSKKEKKHPATRSFQAIRMHVNGELDHVRTFLNDVLDVIKIGGRFLVIAFHSLEDRLVKRFIQQYSTAKKVPKGLPISSDELDASIKLRKIGKAIMATLEEIEKNARSRSAVLRIAERLV